TFDAMEYPADDDARSFYEDNGVGHIYNTSTATQTFIFTQQNNSAGVQGWGARAAAFKAAVLSTAFTATVADAYLSSSEANTRIQSAVRLLNDSGKTSNDLSFRTYGGIRATADSPPNSDIRATSFGATRSAIDSDAETPNDLSSRLLA